MSNQTYKFMKIKCKIIGIPFSSGGFICQTKILNILGLVMLTFFFSVLPAYSFIEQQKEVRGAVTDNEGNTLPGVNIIIDGTSTGAITNIDGNYEITVPGPDAVLLFTFVGYESQSVVVGERSVIDITLSEALTALDEIVVVGYGTQTRRAVTGSVQSVSTTDLEDLPVGQISQRLQGQLAGVQLFQRTGVPGEELYIRVRGAASISAGSSPLYVVDGFPLEGGLSSINPNEIESISILKDAAASSLYGSRANAGVVMITTKRAQAGQSSFSVNAYTGVQTVPQRGRPDVMNAREFATWMKEIAEHRGQPVPEMYQNPEQYGEGFDWYDALLRTAPVSDIGFTYTGSVDRFSTSIVAGYFDQKGAVVNSGFHRISLRANSEFRATDKIKLGINIAPTYSYDSNIRSDGRLWGGPILQGAILASPIYTPYDDEGNMPLTIGQSGDRLFAQPNWLRTAKEQVREGKQLNLLSNAFAEYEILDGLKFRSSINVQLNDRNWYEFHPSTTGHINVPPPQLAQVINDFSRRFSWVAEQMLTYQKSFGAHDLDFTGVYSAEKSKSDILNTSGTNLPDDKIATVSAAATRNALQSMAEWSLLSYIGRVNYSYDNKYYVSLAMRRDGSSRFGADNRWGNFPSASLGWIVSDEAFFPGGNAINMLKLRGSYGLVGNFSIGNYTHLSNIGTTNHTFNDQVAQGRSLTSIGNSILSWEQTSQSNVGFDLMLLGNRITFNYDYYVNYTHDLLYGLPIPQSTGFGSIQSNVGELKFWGHEFFVESRNLIGEFKWNSSLNVTVNRNEVISLGTDDTPMLGNNAIIPGHPIGVLYGMVQLGHYSTAEYNDPNVAKESRSNIGGIKFEDVNNDGVITRGSAFGTDDRTIIGDPTPAFFFGITNRFNYKNFDLSIVASGAYDYVVANMIEQSTGNLDGVFNADRRLINRWRSDDDPGDGRFGVTGGTTGRERDWLHSGFLSDASHLTIKNLSLGYMVPSRLLGPLSSLRAYASIQQLYTFTNYIGSNPEVSNSTSARSQGLDWTHYPIPRTITFGIVMGL